MNFIGTWKLRTMGVPNSEGSTEIMTVPQVLALEDTEENMFTKVMTTAVMEVREDGMITVRIRFTEEQAAALLEEGDTPDEDGAFTLLTYPWKEENGVIKYKVDAEPVEIDGEIIDPWLDVEISEDGAVTFGFLTFIPA